MLNTPGRAFHVAPAPRRNEVRQVEALLKMALTGREHYYQAWLDLILSVPTVGPVLDLGTSEPFRKEMSVLRDRTSRPYFCLDVTSSGEVDVVGDGHHLPFAEAAIGSILCSHVLEHVKRPDMVIDEMRRVLQPGGRAYLTFLDMYPYHAKPGAYADFHRFKRDAVDLLLQEWAHFEVLSDGGLGQVLVNYVPGRLRPQAQVLANLLDRRRPTTATDVFYVVATR